MPTYSDISDPRAGGRNRKRIRKCRIETPNRLRKFSSDFTNTKKHVERFIDSLLQSNGTSLMSFWVYGLPATGLTSFAVTIARQGFTCVKVILAKNFIGRSEDQVSLEILDTFENAYKSKQSAIIIDDIESIIEFSPIGPRFANKTLQALLVLLKQMPPEGHKLAIFTTTSKREAMSMIGIDARYFYEEIELVPLNKPEHLVKVAKESCNANLVIEEDEIRGASEYLRENPVPVKRAIEAIDFAVFEAKDKPLTWKNLEKCLRQHNRTSIN